MTINRTKIVGFALGLAALVPLVELTTRWGSTSLAYFFPKTAEGEFTLCNAPDCSYGFDELQSYLVDNVGKTIQLSIIFQIDSFFGPGNPCNEFIQLPELNDVKGKMNLSNLEVYQSELFPEPKCHFKTAIGIDRRFVRFAAATGSPPTYLYSVNGNFYVTVTGGGIELTSSTPDS